MLIKNKIKKIKFLVTANEKKRKRKEKKTHHVAHLQRGVWGMNENSSYSRFFSCTLFIL
jgi:hypothetical protein